MGVKVNLTILADVSPACGPAGGAVVEGAGVRCQADGLDEVCEDDRRAQPHQGDVVIDQGGVVVGMDDDIQDTPAHFVGV